MWVSQLGVLMLLLLAGMETDLSLVRAVGRAAFSVSVTGIVIPFVCGFVIGQFLPDSLLPHPDQRFIASLFLGTALSISSVKIVAMVVREMNFVRRNIGQVILASAIIDDTIGWIIIAITFGLAEHGTFDWLSLTKGVVGTLLFLAASFTVGRTLVFKLIRWTNDNFVSEAPVIAAILVVMGAMALTTHLIGVHNRARRLCRRRPGRRIADPDAPDRRAAPRHHGGPVHAGVLRCRGLERRSDGLENPELARLTVGLILIASLGKSLGAFAGRLVRRPHGPRVARARKRHERTRLDRGDRRHHWPVDGRAQSEPVHDDRRHGGHHHAGDATVAALGASPACR